MHIVFHAIFSIIFSIGYATNQSVNSSEPPSSTAGSSEYKGYGLFAELSAHPVLAFLGSVLLIAKLIQCLNQWCFGFANLPEMIRAMRNRGNAQNEAEETLLSAQNVEITIRRINLPVLVDGEDDNDQVLADEIPANINEDDDDQVSADEIPANINEDDNRVIEKDE